MHTDIYPYTYIHTYILHTQTHFMWYITKTILTVYTMINDKNITCRVHLSSTTQTYRSTCFLMIKKKKENTILKSHIISISKKYSKKYQSHNSAVRWKNRMNSMLTRWRHCYPSYVCERLSFLTKPKEECLSLEHYLVVSVSTLSPRTQAEP